jgi:hypothetical protein
MCSLIRFVLPTLCLVSPSTLFPATFRSSFHLLKGSWKELRRVGEKRVDVAHSRAYRHVLLSPNVTQRQPLPSPIVFPFIPVDLLLVGRGRRFLALRLASEIQRHCGGRITCLTDSVVDLFDGA